MITLLMSGRYSIAGTKDHKSLLYLDQQGYQWSYAPKIGQLLTFSKHAHATDHVLAQGTYHIYRVKDEPDLVDLDHLELSLGRGKWQGYLLLTGLPSPRNLRRRILATSEVITRRRYKQALGN